MLTIIILFAFSAAYAMASYASMPPTRTLSRRNLVVPSIASGFTPQETAQLHDAFWHALQLATYPIVSPAEKVDPILQKYFNIQDKAIVLGRFHKRTCRKKTYRHL